jgi:hypothetical protein
VGDFVELLTRVELFTRKANAAEPNRARLAVIGHSLGGTMVYTALANILKARAVEAAENQDSPDPRASVIRGFGDLVVLVNPAFEASLYAPLKEIADRFRRFSPLQTPVMVTIESETDMANRFWFPLGRNVETAFQHTGPQSPRAEIVSAVGHYAPFWTHRLTAAAPARRRSLPDFFPASPSCSCDLAMEPIGDAEAAELVALLAGHGSQAPVLGQEPTPFGRGRLALVNPIVPKNPFWVVRASDDVLPGHSGIFTTYIIDFVRRVILEANAHGDASR